MTDTWLLRATQLSSNPYSQNFQNTSTTTFYKYSVFKKHSIYALEAREKSRVQNWKEIGKGST
jgi:hypothetical protein